MDSLLGHCTRKDGEKLDEELMPAPSVLAEDGRGMLYALGADGVVRAAAARHIAAAARSGAADDDDDDGDGGPDLDSLGTPGGGTAVKVFEPEPSIDFEPRTIAVSPSGHFAVLGGLRHAHGSSAPASSALVVVSLRSGMGGGGGEVDLGDLDGAGCRSVPLLEVGPGKHCSPRHPVHCEPSCVE
jgi:nuclear pore complex protein Nup88